MAFVSRQKGEVSSKLIHSNICFVVVPLGLCAFAAVVHWLVQFT